MPAKGQKNMKLYERVDKETNKIIGINKTVKSKLNASEKYDKENVDNIRLRVPKGWKEIIQNYVRESEKYSSVNSMICELIKKEIGLENQ